LIDENDLERLTDQQAIELIFAAGFSTAETVTDLSGRGVGMDVVRTALARVKGGVELSSEAGKGTRLRLSLPLSMAVTNVMIVESDQQVFGCRWMRWSKPCACRVSKFVGLNNGKRLYCVGELCHWCR